MRKAIPPKPLITVNIPPPFESEISGTTSLAGIILTDDLSEPAGFITDSVWFFKVDFEIWFGKAFTLTVINMRMQMKMRNGISRVLEALINKQIAY